MELKMPVNNQKLILLTFIFSNLIGTMAGMSVFECYSQKCDGIEYGKRLKEGKFICLGTDDGKFDVSDPCRFDCKNEYGNMRGYKKADDQNACFCEHCKIGDNFKKYCDKPLPEGKSFTSSADCEKVCSGEAKWYGSHCEEDD